MNRIVPWNKTRWRSPRGSIQMSIMLGTIAALEGSSRAFMASTCVMRAAEAAPEVAAIGLVTLAAEPIIAAAADPVPGSRIGSMQAMACVHAAFLATCSPGDGLKPRLMIGASVGFEAIVCCRFQTLPQQAICVPPDRTLSGASKRTNSVINELS